MSTKGMPQFSTVLGLVSGLMQQCTGMKLDTSSLTALTLQVKQEDPATWKVTLPKDSSLKLTGIVAEISFREEKATLTLLYGPSQDDIIKASLEQVRAMQHMMEGIKNRGL